jgi:NhaP-type Na+/H+ and K+/H+ antiporter
MSARIQETLALAMTAQTELLDRAANRVVCAGHVNDEFVRARLFDDATEMRRIAEFMGAVIRNMEAELEEHPVLGARGKQRVQPSTVQRLRRFRVVGGCA